MFWALRKDSSSVVMLKGKIGEMTVVWFTNFVVLLRMRAEIGVEEMEVAHMHYMEVTTLDAVEKNPACTCVRWSPYDRKNHIVCGKELKHDGVKLRECCRP